MRVGVSLRLMLLMLLSEVVTGPGWPANVEKKKKEKICGAAAQLSDELMTLVVTSENVGHTGTFNASCSVLVQQSSAPHPIWFYSKLISEQDMAASSLIYERLEEP